MVFHYDDAGNEIEYKPMPSGDSIIEIGVFEDDTPVASHTHEFIEIVLISKGTCIHRYHETEVTLIPGDMFIVVPHEIHSYDFSKNILMYNCLFYKSAMEHEWNELQQISGVFDMLLTVPFYRQHYKQQEVLHLEPADLSVMESILKKMLHEQLQKDAGFQLAQKAYLIQFLTYYGRTWQKQFSDKYHEYNTKREMLVDALHFVETNVDSEIRLSDLAAKSCLSPQGFRKVFKEVTGLTPLDYINTTRIKQAINFMTESNLSISEISEIVGINDTNYFSRLFRKKTGYSPSEFRRQNRRPN